MKREKHWKFFAVRDGIAVILVKGGRRAYLWIGDAKKDIHLATVSGPLVLRALAESILDEVPKQPVLRRKSHE